MFCCLCFFSFTCQQKQTAKRTTCITVWQASVTNPAWKDCRPYVLVTIFWRQIRHSVIVFSPLKIPSRPVIKHAVIIIFFSFVSFRNSGSLNMHEYASRTDLGLRPPICLCLGFPRKQMVIC